MLIELKPIPLHYMVLENMNYMKLIINPIAGGGKTNKLWESIKCTIDSMGIQYDYDLTQYPLHATELAQDAVNKGYTTIVSVGGDGTINEIVNGIFLSNAFDKVKLGIISTGTGADYIRTLGLPRDYRLACKTLVNDNVKKVDIGIAKFKINGRDRERVFVNFAGAGFDAEIVKRTTIKYKSFGKVASYLLALFSTFMTYVNKKILLETDNIVCTHKMCTIIVGIGKYGGGGMKTTPGAEINDGLFDILVVGNLSKFDLIKSLPMIYRGTHLKHPKVSLYKSKFVKLSSSEDILVQADGDIIGATPVEFSIKPSSLSVIV